MTVNTTGERAAAGRIEQFLDDMRCSAADLFFASEDS
jgi:hypothetical protein